MKKIVFVVLLMAVSMVAFGQDVPVDPDPGGGFNIWQIISMVLGAATIFFGAAVSKVRSKGFAALMLGKEALELVDVVLKASADGTFDQVEQQNIKKEALDVRSAWRALLGRSA